MPPRPRESDRPTVCRYPWLPDNADADETEPRGRAAPTVAAVPRVCLSRSEAARALGIGVSTLQAWERDGLAPPSFTAPGGRRMYPVSRLIEWAEAKAGITAESRAGD